MQKRFFQCKIFASATHTAFFHIGNMPYAPGLQIFFGRGLKNLIRIRLRFIRGIENPARIGFHFIRGMENPAGLMFIFIRGIKESPFFQVPV